MSNILFTSDTLNSSVFLEMLGKQTKYLLHLPLEKFDYHVREEDAKTVIKRIRSFTYAVHGNLRNAYHFTEWVNNSKQKTQMQELIHISADQPTSDHLEENQIPAVMPLKNAKGIDIIEFLLRISKEGAVLYPTSSDHTEEIPGLLKELEIPVMEFTVCRERTLDNNEIKEYRKLIENQNLSTVIIHSRSCLNRVRLAFPNLQLDNLDIISANRKVTELLIKEGLSVKAEANGNWHSMAKTVIDYLN